MVRTNSDLNTFLEDQKRQGERPTFKFNVDEVSGLSRYAWVAAGRPPEPPKEHPENGEPVHVAVANLGLDEARVHFELKASQGRVKMDQQNPDGIWNVDLIAPPALRMPTSGLGLTPIAVDANSSLMIMPGSATHDILQVLSHVVHPKGLGTETFSLVVRCDS